MGIKCSALYAIARNPYHIEKDGTKCWDRWPIHFRPECDRTYFSPITGEDKGLIDIIIELDKSGYDLVDYEELKRRIK